MSSTYLLSNEAAYKEKPAILLSSTSASPFLPVASSTFFTRNAVLDHTSLYKPKRPHRPWYVKYLIDSNHKRTYKIQSQN